MENKLKLIHTESFIFSISVIVLVCSLSISYLLADESVIESELKGIVQEYGFDIDVEVVPNRETNLQDLSISPAGDMSYSTAPFIYAVVYGVSEITNASFAYRLFIGMIIIDINDELWAISAENCRNTFKLKTVEKQNDMLRKNLKRLRY